MFLLQPQQGLRKLPYSIVEVSKQQEGSKRWRPQSQGEKVQRLRKEWQDFGKSLKENDTER